MSGEIVPAVIETVQRGLEFLADHEKAITGGVMLVEGARTAGKLAIGAVKPLLPLLGQQYAGTSEAAQLA